MWAQVLNALIGLLAIIFPAIANVTKTAANINHILGPLILASAVISFWECNRNTRFFNIITGICLILFPIIFGFPYFIFWADIVCGVLVISFSLIKGKVDYSFGGGWRCLLQ